MASRSITFASASAILGGWLPIMAPAVVTIALRLGEFESTALDSTYAITLALGWLSMIASLVAAGYASDALDRRESSRTWLVRLSIPLIAVGGIVMAAAQSTAWLAIAWVVIQLPSAMVITTALAEGGAHLRADPRSLVSGWAGAMPILALLLGTVGVRVLGDSLAWAFIAPAVAGALLCLPLAITAAPHPTAPSRTSARSPSTGAIAGMWLMFLAASFLLAWTTSTVNGFLVVFVQERIASTVSDLADTSTLAVILASSLAVIASISASRFAHGRDRPITLWCIAAAACAAALAILVLAPSSVSLLVVAATFGIAFGMANGVEVAVVVALRGEDAYLGRDMGILTAITSAPYVLVPVVAAVLLFDSASTEVTTLFAAAAIVALFAAVLLLTARKRHSPIADN